MWGAGAVVSALDSRDLGSGSSPPNSLRPPVVIHDHLNISQKSSPEVRPAGEAHGLTNTSSMEVTTPSYIMDECLQHKLIWRSRTIEEILVLDCNVYIRCD